MFSELFFPEPKLEEEAGTVFGQPMGPSDEAYPRITRVPMGTQREVVEEEELEDDEWAQWLYDLD